MQKVKRVTDPVFYVSQQLNVATIAAYSLSS